MSNFRRPTTPEGYARRKEALQSSHPQVQARITKNLAEEEEGDRRSAENIVWQLQHGDDDLSRFAAGEVDKAIDWYDGKSHDPSGWYGRLLAMISHHLNVTIGDLISARGDRKRIISLSRSEKSDWG